MTIYSNEYEALATVQFQLEIKKLVYLEQRGIIDTLSSFKAPI